MEEKANKIINKLTNTLSQINPGDFMNQIKAVKESSEYLDISKKFCDIITNIKAQILFDISEEIQSLVKKKEESINDISDDTNIDNNNDILKEIKNIISQFKFKISNLSSNISELNSNLTIISGNIKKQKYSLATLRLEKLYKLKSNMDLNLTSLEKLEDKLSDILKLKKEKKTNRRNDDKNIKINMKILQSAKTPSPMNKNVHNLSTIQINKKNNINKSKKNLSSNKILNLSVKKSTFKITEKKRDKSLSNISNTSNTSKNKYSIPIKKINRKNEIKNDINNKKINNNIDTKLVDTQKEIIDKLKKEIENLKKQNNCNNNDECSIDNNMQLKLENNVLLFLNEKLKIISNLIFSITFSINNLQNKNISIDDEYNNIKNNLINMTSEISEIKSNLLKMSLENENIFKIEKKEINNSILNISKINIENDFNLSFYKNKIKNLKEENENLKSSIEQLKTKINSLNKLISSPVKENDTNDNSEILKESLKNNERKLKEIKELYDADINSKTVIEKLLRKNIEDMRETYEQKIVKLNKKLEEKNKEVTEKNNIINKINNKIIKNLNINEENKRISSKEDDILKINDELSKVNKEIKNDLSLENSISLSLFKDNNEENDKKEIKIKKLEDEIIALKLKNNKLLNELNDIKPKDEILSLKEINSSFANEINSIKNTMNNQNKDNDKRNSGNNQNDLFKSKTYSNESEYDLVVKLKNDINLLQINKRNIEAQNKELNEKIIKKDKEIICLITNNNKEKKNINEQYKTEIEKLKNEIKDKTNMNEQLKNEINTLQKKLLQGECVPQNGGEIMYNNKNNFEKDGKNNEIKKFKNLEKKLNIILLIEAERKWLFDEEDEDEEEEDEETDEDFIVKMKKINEYTINDKYEMKVYKKENRKMIHRYEDTLEQNNELKKKMIIIEEIVVNKQNELYNNLKKGFKALLCYLTINNKSKDKVIYFLNLIQFSEQEIKIIMNTKK